MRRRCASFLLALGAFLGPLVAAASPGYPDALQTDLGLASAPGCGLCHHAATAPVGAADTPFGKATVAHGLVTGDATSLSRALDSLRTDGVDSDGDGAKDLDELSWGGNPNVASAPEGVDSPPLAYGCSWASKPVEGSGAVVVASLLAALTRRRGRRRGSAR